MKTQKSLETRRAKMFRVSHLGICVFPCPLAPAGNRSRKQTGLHLKSRKIHFQQPQSSPLFYKTWEGPHAVEVFKKNRKVTTLMSRGDKDEDITLICMDRGHGSDRNEDISTCIDDDDRETDDSPKI